MTTGFSVQRGNVRRRSSTEVDIFGLSFDDHRYIRSLLVSTSEQTKLAYRVERKAGPLATVS